MKKIINRQISQINVFLFAAIFALGLTSVWGSPVIQTQGNPKPEAPSPNQSREIENKETPVGIRPAQVLAQQRKIARMASRVDFNQPGLGKAQAMALNRAFQELDLTDEQKNKIRTVWVQSGEQLRRLTSVRRAKAIVFDDALYSAEFDPKDAEKKAIDLSITEGELLKTQMKMIIDIRQILNPEQGLKFRQILEEERARPLKSLPVGATQ